jgi:1-acyl-sn-glycerol-3-phosphate acyltransferase
VTDAERADDPSESSAASAPEPLKLGRPMTLGDRIVYRSTRVLIRLVSRVVFRVEVSGLENFPVSGACVVAPVHRSNLDTPILAWITGRRLRFMGKDTLWKPAFGNWFLTALGGFPVSRGTADREALRACQAIIEREEPLVMFPEGTRRFGETISDLFDGPAFISARTGAPIVPVAVGGSERVMPKGAKFPRPKKVVLIVGKPIVPPVSTGRVPRRVVRELTEELQVALQELFDEAQHRAGVR